MTTSAPAASADTQPAVKGDRRPDDPAVEDTANAPLETSFPDPSAEG